MPRRSSLVYNQYASTQNVSNQWGNDPNYVALHFHPYMNDVTPTPNSVYADFTQSTSADWVTGDSNYNNYGVLNGIVVATYTGLVYQGSGSDAGGPVYGFAVKNDAGVFVGAVRFEDAPHFLNFQFDLQPFDIWFAADRGFVNSETIP